MTQRRQSRDFLDNQQHVYVIYIWTDKCILSNPFSEDCHCECSAKMFGSSSRQMFREEKEKARQRNRDNLSAWDVFIPWPYPDPSKAIKSCQGLSEALICYHIKCQKVRGHEFDTPVQNRIIASHWRKTWFRENLEKKSQKSPQMTKVSAIHLFKIKSRLPHTQSQPRWPWPLHVSSVTRFCRHRKIKTAPQC